MANPAMIVARLYGPIVMFLASLVATCFVKKGKKGTILRLKPFGAFIEYELPISNPVIVRFILAAAMLLSLSMYMVYDFSAFFPQHFRLEVFYDRDGINESLAAFSSRELTSFRIPRDYYIYTEQYFERLDTEVQKILNIPKFFGAREGSVHSSGETSFIVEKTAGWQNYRIAEAKGELIHVLESPNIPREEFYTRFQKMAVKDDYIRPTFADIFIRHNMILRPQFKQFLAESRNSEGVLFKFSFIGITRVAIFPWPKVSNTVYLANFEEIGLVPIAYAIYR